ncbi:MAG: transporter substrate-binding domain-containing protein [Bacteroidales bacterium]|nr:transporter substrate-binding domain-containing protein [Bacteroidales bacterium]
MVNKNNFKLPLVLIIVSLLFFMCRNNNTVKNSVQEKPITKKEKSFIKKIREKGKITAVTECNSTSYFIYRGTPMGYQYELLNSFSEYLGVGLNIIVNNDIEKSIEMLNNNECDLMAIDLTINKEREKLVDFTSPIGKISQVLVQRKPKNWRKMKTWEEVEKKLIRDPIQLAGKKIYVQKNTSFVSRLKNLSNEIGDSIIIIEDPDKGMEELIEMVANGDIDYTVCDEHVALVNQKYYPDIDVKTPVSFNQNIAWAVKKGNDSLRIYINKWLEDYLKSKQSVYVYNKYFKNTRAVYLARSKYSSLKSGQISPYDNVVKKESSKINWDWRLLSSLIYQESGFNPKVRSWVGAFGLMQLMPNTAKKYGVDTSSPPDKQIEAGIKYIKLLDAQLKDYIPDSIERKKFVLASYNVGIGHVFDARRLAEKYNKNPDLWNNNVDSFLLLKSKPKYYLDSVVYYGYCRGSEPFNFVNEIFERYNNYKNVVKE